MDHLTSAQRQRLQQLRVDTMRIQKEYEERRMVFIGEQHQRLEINQMGSILSSAANLVPIKSALPKAWTFNAAAKCFACKGTGEKQCPYNPEDVQPCECKK